MIDDESGKVVAQVLTADASHASPAERDFANFLVQALNCERHRELISEMDT